MVSFLLHAGLRISGEPLARSGRCRAFGTQRQPAGEAHGKGNKEQEIFVER